MRNKMAWLAEMSGVTDEALLLADVDEDVRVLVVRSLGISADGLAMCVDLNLSEYTMLSQLERRAVEEAYAVARGYQRRKTTIDRAVDVLAEMMGGNQ
jgi:hypothetical protein